jgi:outer membrane protein TolC
LTGVYRQYQNARQQVEQYEKDILPDARSTLELVRIGYQQGEFGYIEFLSSQRTYTRVNVDYLRSLRELRQSSAQLQGLLLSGGFAPRQQ